MASPGIGSPPARQLPYPSRSTLRGTAPPKRRAARPARIQKQRLPTFYLRLVTLAMVTGTFVLIEPAPIDLALLGLLAFGLITHKLTFTPAQGTPIMLLGVVAAATIVSIVNAPDESRAIFYCLVTLYLMLSWLFFAGVISKFGNEAIDAIFKGYVIAGMISAIPAVLSYFRLIPFQDTLLLYDRPKGFFKDPNVYGPYLVTVAVYALSKLDAGRRRQSRYSMWLAVFLAALAGLFLSFSRACWINASIAITVFFTLKKLYGPKRRKRYSLTRIALALMLVAGAAGLVLSSSQIGKMLSVRVGSNGLQGYDNDRFSTQSKALESAIRQPLGIGPGQAEIVFDYSTHSTYLRLLSENGVLALLAFAGLCAMTLVRATYLAATSKNQAWKILMMVTSACLAGHLVNSFVIDTVHWRHPWLFLALPWVSHADLTLSKIRSVRVMR